MSLRTATCGSVSEWARIQELARSSLHQLVGQFCPPTKNGRHPIRDAGRCGATEFQLRCDLVGYTAAIVATIGGGAKQIAMAVERDTSHRIRSIGTAEIIQVRFRPATV